MSDDFALFLVFVSVLMLGASGMYIVVRKNDVREWCCPQRHSDYVVFSDDPPQNTNTSNREPDGSIHL